MNVKYRTEWHPNPNCVTIHLNDRLPFEGSTNRLVSTGDLDDRLLRIDSLRGVESVSACNKYELNVTKGSAFDWGEVLPNVMASLGDILGGEMIDDGLVGHYMRKDRHTAQRPYDPIEDRDDRW